MAVTVSEVSICNLGLTYLSSARIESLTEDSEPARKCNAIYEYERDGLTEEHNWNFAKTELSLALLDDAPTLTDKWLYRFQLPTDCLRVIRVQGDYPYAVYGDKLFYNAETVKIEYIKQVTDVTLFTKMYVKALAARIAAALAYGITQNASMADVAEKRMIRIVKAAKQDDGQEGVGTYLQSGSLLDNRG